MDTTSRLLMFLDVVELGNFAKVAESHRIDRSVVSKQMNKLEEELGVRLLNRSTRTISLTAAGAEMVKKATEMRFLLSETIQIAENYHTEPRGLLKITSSAIIGRRYLLPVINDFQKRFPQVEVELNLEDRMVDIVGEGYDLAFRIGQPKVSNLISRQLARNRLVILATPEFLQTYGEPATLEELAKLPAASYASNTLRIDEVSYINDQGAEVAVPIHSTFRSNDGDAIRLKALSGSTYFLTPAFLVSDEIKQGLLTPILTHIKLPEFNHLYAIYPHRELPVRTQLFFDAVREFIGKDKPIWENNIPGFDSMYQ
ncbi:LysR family transcriptional regulator [Neptuniibacter sp. 2_MG-2023]|uniref:LysR family transcriptional regulator n=1 Tax=Neptuniibacter sp. 2_MG-2023 TaxID=3062671 RepID=UPI0026E279F9|nr:LysR family transcriptional regulator [Neptuniibacter sp. 2_MG-2023]MDO6514311.1 LysR family transcriptional regulator [Neptuniibacter sp. 2_MG-2023]